MPRKAKNIHIVQVFEFPFHQECGAYDKWGRWFPNPELNFYKLFRQYADFPTINNPKSYEQFFYTLRYARILARDRPFLYRKLHDLPHDTYLVLFHTELNYTKHKRRKVRKKKKKIVAATPEPYMFQYVQVSAPFSNNPRWFTVLRIKNDHRLAERYVARLKIPESKAIPKAAIRHVRIFTYTAAKRVFDNERSAQWFMWRCSQEVLNGYREEEIPEYLDRETGDTKKVETLIPSRIVRELRLVESETIDKRLYHVKETDLVVPMPEKKTKTCVVRDIDDDLYNEAKRYAQQEGLGVSNWIKTAIESHIQSMRYRELSFDKEIFPNIDISDDNVVFDTPDDGDNVVLEEKDGVKYVIEF